MRRTAGLTQTTLGCPECRYDLTPQAFGSPTQMPLELTCPECGLKIETRAMLGSGSVIAALKRVPGRMSRVTRFMYETVSLMLPWMAFRETELERREVVRGWKRKVVAGLVLSHIAALGASYIINVIVNIIYIFEPDWHIIYLGGALSHVPWPYSSGYNGSWRGHTGPWLVSPWIAYAACAAVFAPVALAIQSSLRKPLNGAKAIRACVPPLIWLPVYAGVCGVALDFARTMLALFFPAPDPDPNVAMIHSFLPAEATFSAAEHLVCLAVWTALLFWWWMCVYSRTMSRQRAATQALRLVSASLLLTVLITMAVSLVLVLRYGVDVLPMPF